MNPTACEQQECVVMQGDMTIAWEFVSPGPHQLLETQANNALTLKEKQHPRNIYVAGLPSAYTEKWLFSLFEPFGEVMSVKLDRRSKTAHTFGFVLMKSARSARRALAALSPLTLGGHRVQLRLARLTPGLSLEGDLPSFPVQCHAAVGTTRAPHFAIEEAGWGFQPAARPPPPPYCSPAPCFLPVTPPLAPVLPQSAASPPFAACADPSDTTDAEKVAAGANLLPPSIEAVFSAPAVFPSYQTSAVAAPASILLPSGQPAFFVVVGPSSSSFSCGFPRPCQQQPASEGSEGATEDQDSSWEKALADELRTEWAG